MGRPKKFENGFKVVKVYLQPEEFERIFAKCGGGSVSDWARQAMLAELDGIKAVIGEYKDYGSANRDDKIGERESASGRGVAVRGERSKVRPMRAGSTDAVAHISGPPAVRPGKTCRHGTMAGHSCWQCGGLAVVE
jgi:hypothetical protein